MRRLSSRKPSTRLFEGASGSGTATNWQLADSGALREQIREG
jgi:hypothetical protein